MQVVLIMIFSLQKQSILYNVQRRKVLKLLILLLCMSISASQVFAASEYRPQYYTQTGTYKFSDGKDAVHYNVYSTTTQYSSNVQTEQTAQDYLRRFKLFDDANRYLPAQSSVRVSGDAVLVLMDYSISMDIWVKMTEEILAYILPKLPYTTYVGLRVIAGTSPFYKSGSGCTNTNLIRDFKSTNSQRDANIIKGINEVSIGGNTPLTYSLYNAIENDLSKVSVPPGKVKKIILITDAGETCGFKPCLYIQDVVRRYADVEIDVIEVGGLKSLRCLSTETGGNYFEIFDNSADKFEREKYDFEAALEDAFNVPKGFVARERKIDPQKLDKLLNHIGIEKDSSNRAVTPLSTYTKGKGPDVSLQEQTKSKQKGYKFIDASNIKFDDE